MLQCLKYRKWVDFLELGQQGFHNHSDVPKPVSKLLSEGSSNQVINQIFSSN